MIKSSSSDAESILTRLHPEQLTVLVEILSRTNVRHMTFVESIYNERARHFRETLRFLKDIGWAHESAGQLMLAGEAALTKAEQFLPCKAIESITGTPCPYQAILANYLVQFRIDAGRIVHRASAQSRLEQSGIRNLLIEVRVLTRESDEDSYILNGEFAHLYLWAKNVHGATSKTELLRRANERDQLGTSAEIAVLGFEKQRLGSEWFPKVEHVSAKNPGACFDIKSVSINDGQPVNRFIEVKAVSADSYQFFWTVGELEAACLLREKYFLYLLPASGRDNFDLSKMQILQDAYSTVYQSPDAWLKSENLIVCRRKSPPTNL
jgi:hypothetical protein